MNKKIIMTAGEWSEMISGIGDIIKACPDAWNCPRSFDDFWENILYVEGQDD